MDVVAEFVGIELQVLHLQWGTQLTSPINKELIGSETSLNWSSEEDLLWEQSQ